MVVAVSNEIIDQQYRSVVDLSFSICRPRIHEFEQVCIQYYSETSHYFRLNGIIDTTQNNTALMFPCWLIADVEGRCDWPTRKLE